MGAMPYPDINRAALIIRFKKPFMDWLLYTSKEHDGEEHQLKPEDIQKEGFDSKNVYLIPAFEADEKYEKYLRKHCAEIFEQIIGSWYTDPSMWPKDMSWKVFNEWFNYEIHTMVFDTIPDEPLEHED